MRPQGCPFHHSSTPKPQALGNALLIEALPAGRVSAARNAEQRELYALCAHLIEKVWSKIDTERMEFSPGLLTDRLLVQLPYGPRDGLRRLQPGELPLMMAVADDPLRHLQNLFGLTVESALSRTLRGLQEQRDPAWLRFQDIYKQASSFPASTNTAEQYLLSGLNNAVTTSFGVIRCVQALREERQVKGAEQVRSLVQDLNASRNFLVHLANTHLVTNRALGALVWNSVNGSFESRFFELDQKHGLQLKPEMRNLLPVEVTREEQQHPEMLHDRMGCPALKAGTNVVSKFYDWVLSTLQEVPERK